MNQVRKIGLFLVALFLVFTATVYLSMDRIHYHDYLVHVNAFYGFLLFIGVFFLMAFPAFWTPARLWVRIGFVLLFVFTQVLFSIQYNLDVESLFGRLLVPRNPLTGLGGWIIPLSLLSAVLGGYLMIRTWKIGKTGNALHLTFLFVYILFYLLLACAYQIDALAFLYRLLRFPLGNVIQGSYDLIFQEASLYLSIGLTAIFLNGKVFSDELPGKRKDPSRTKAVLMWVFLGWAGAERLYLGTKKWIIPCHLVYLTVCLTFFFYNGRAFTLEPVWGNQPVFLILFLLSTLGNAALWGYSLFDILRPKSEALPSGS